ncbi:sugar ABC transporter substrate-binding protein [Actinoplanes sp. SE50]|uniref:substrate-binding domain-containing protein n=1 Tax=unclassified Actinoplanes TaxID=2626549 RepID=UPI00023ECE68|nr:MULTISPECIES: substrate-binding domain-containing protein [unclassified Actinoplanes]AEV83812.1 simple sugar transport system substrate-binding protein [Actinoplanes sp. SE50/110]ATO82044.1 sugar ABC transporter substrate-binding protein [Actinoplanes sp. SE50]SLL99452.1 sugar ABC transporter substrate-binding protein [Actinoplanes sp. SE50/110]
MRKRLLAAGTATVLALAACSGGGRDKSAADTSGAGGNAPGSSGYTIAFVTHETPGDTFWDKVRAGAVQAAKDEGVTLKYSNDPDAGKQAQLIQSAVDAKVNGIATTLVTPDALAGAVKSATTAGIPVVGLNAGIDQYQKLGALMYFGSDESLAGTSLGKRIAGEGAKHPLCVIHQTGSVALEARCAGVKSAVPATENLQVNGADDSAVTTTLQAKLAQDKSIDYIVTLGAPVALDAINAKQQASSEAKLVTFDLNQEMAKRIKNGEVEFAIDQQPYVQGYMAVTSLYLYLKNGNDIGGGRPVLTGPSFVDQTNIDKILPFTEKNTR